MRTLPQDAFDRLKADGAVFLQDFLQPDVVAAVKREAQAVFAAQMRRFGFLPEGDFAESTFERAMERFFAAEPQAFFNCGKMCQHLISLHRLGISDDLLSVVRALGVQAPNICTRPVIFFNHPNLAKEEVYYKTPPHQDWSSMQGSLNALVIWVPLVDIPGPLGALEIIPGSHRWGVQPYNFENGGFGHIQGVDESLYRPVEVKAGDILAFSAFLVHRSGNNVTDSIRWSCHFRYNDLLEPTFIERNYPNPYIYRPIPDVVTPGFPTPETLAGYFGPAPLTV